MAPAQDELNIRLDSLEKMLPALIADFPDPGDFWRVFTAEADAIEEFAGDHGQIVAARVAVMLARHGRYLVVGDWVPGAV